MAILFQFFYNIPIDSMLDQDILYIVSHGQTTFFGTVLIDYIINTLFQADAYNVIDKRHAEKKWSGHVRLILYIESSRA